MPPTTLKLRHGADKSDLVSLGVWIRDVPEELNSWVGNGTYQWISMEHHLLAFGTSIGTLYLFDLATGHWWAPLCPPDADVIHELYFTPDRLFIRTDDGAFDAYTLPGLEFRGVLHTLPNRSSLAPPVEEFREF